MTTPYRRLAAAALLSLAPALAAADAAAAPYGPLAFLVGHCWRGAFPESPVVDEHCFTWVYGDKFVRDRHVLQRGPGKGEARGESLYLWDSAAHELQYLYVESGGGFSRGTVVAEGDALVFPAARYVEDGQVQMVRSRWTRLSADAYEVRTEFLVKDQWVRGFSARMERVAGPAAIE